MDDPASIELAATIAGGIVVGALYSATNAGLNTLGEARLLALREEGGPLSAVAERAVRLERLIRTRLLTGRVITAALSAACATVLALPGGPWIALLAGVGTGFVYALFAELAATIARRRAPGAALQMLRWMRPLELLVALPAAPIDALARMLGRVIRPAEESNEIEARAVEHIIEQGEERGTIDEDHAQLLLSVLEFRDTVVREVMVPRIKIEAFEIDTDVTEVLARMQDTGHSRYPVYRGNIDHIEGVLYAKDLFRALHRGEVGVKLGSLVRKPVLLAPEMKKIGDVLREMQQRRFHLAVVVDEFGGTGGIVTLEDILEEIVGEIEDEHDDGVGQVAERGPGHYVADAAISVYDLAEFLGEQLVEDVDGPPEFDSLGGMMVQLAGRVPTPGDEIRAGAFDLRVLEGDDRAVQRVEIVRRSADPPLEAAQ